MKEFSDLLKDIRIKCKLTQKAACQDICSLREYQRIESDRSEPSTYFLRKMSQRLGYDFEAYYFMLMSNNESTAFLDHTHVLSDFAAARDFLSLHRQVGEYLKLPMYSTFENRKMLIYYDSMYYTEVEKDFDKVTELCMQVIRDDDPSATADSFCSHIFSRYAIYCAHALAKVAAEQENAELSIRISLELIDRLDELDRDDISLYQSKTYRRNLHQTLLYNLSLEYFECEDYANAEKSVDRAIKYAADQMTMYRLGEIAAQKADILCKAGRLDEAGKYVSLSSGLLLIQKNEGMRMALKEYFREEYPELPDILWG